MQPKVSVIIPVYNTEKYLYQCLDSLSRQTMRELEFICINDGSTDSSLSILESFADKDNRFRIFNQANSGVSAARNKGLKEVRGEYVCFVDSDDYIDLNLMKSIFEIGKKNDADIVVFGGASFPKADGGVDSKLNTKNAIYKDFIINALFTAPGSRPFIANKLYRTKIIKNYNINFNENLVLGEDQAFIFDVFPFAKTVVFTDKKFYYYRQHENSTMHFWNSNIESKVAEHLKIVEYIVKSWQNKDIIELYGKSLAEWILEFLNNDLTKCNYNFKINAYNRIINLIYKITDVNILNINAKQKLDFMKENLKYDNTKISVIIPVYNAEEYLCETLECLKKQTFNEYELIFIDAGSEDNSYNILLDYSKKDSRVQLKKAKRMYSGEARNLGLKYAQGDYLLFLDADDFFAPDMLSSIYQRADNTDADICVFAADQYDHVTKKKKPMPWTLKPQFCIQGKDTFSLKDNAKNIYCFTTPAPWNKLFRREFIEKYNLLFQETRSANDMAFVMTALALASKISILDKTLLTYRVNNAKSLQGSQSKKPEAFYEALKELKFRLERYEVMKLAEAAFINFCLDFCFYNLGTLKSAVAYEKIYNLIKNEALDYFEINGKNEEYFYAYKINRIYEKLQDMNKISIFEFAIKYNAPFIANKDIDLPARVPENFVNNNPLVSLVLPSLNVAEFIGECILSVITQNLKNIEIICVDAGSNDGTLEIINYYAAKDKRIKVISSDKRSYGYQVNLGLRAARGKYFAIVETDDYIMPDILENLVKIADSNRLDFIKADFCKFIGNANKREFTHFNIAPEEWMYDKLINPSDDFRVFRAHLYTWAGIYNLAFLRENNIWHNETAGASYQDNGFWFQTMTQAKRIMFVHKNYYMLRRDNPNSSYFSKDKVYCMCEEYDFIRNFLRKDKMLEIKFSGLCAFYRYANYNWTLERINESDKLDFIKKYSKDFKRILEEGELDVNLYSEYAWKRIFRIIQDPEMFYYYEFAHSSSGRFNLKSLNSSDQITILKKWIAFSDHNNYELQMNKKKSKIKEKNKENEVKSVEYYKKELENIKSGLSFRLGRIITWIPRKIRGGIRCYKQHGLLYTLKRCEIKFLSLFK